MKRIFTLALVACIGLMAHAQSPRMVLLEHFTQASCGYCPAGNEHLDAITSSMPDKITYIKYQVSWPGYDPMNLHNPTEVATRKNLYSVSGVPYSVLDGNYYSGSYGDISTASVSARAAVPSPFEINLSHRYSPNKDSVYVHMVVRATQDFTGTQLKAYMTVIEELITFDTPPGNNGETEFRHVMKKMLPNDQGTDLPDTWAAQDSVVIDGAWEFANVYDVEEIAVVAFVQQMNTEEVHQAVYSAPLPPEPMFTHDVAIDQVQEIPQLNCMGKLEPVVTIKNWGAENLTSLEITCQVNEEEPHTMQWSGDLAFYETEDVTFTEFGFDVLDENVLNISISQPNGQTDENLTNNEATEDFGYILADGSVTVLFMTDDTPSENYFEFLDSQGNVIYTEGPFTQANQFNTFTYDFDHTDCYSFVMYDSGNNGLNGGFYTLKTNNQAFANGNNFTTGKQETQFSVEYVGIQEPETITGLSIGPNPFATETELNFTLKKATDVKVEIYTLTGQLAKSMVSQNLPEGAHTLTLNASELRAGVYMARIQAGSKVYMRKMIKE